MKSHIIKSPGSTGTCEASGEHFFKNDFLREQGRNADGLSHTYAIPFGVFGEAAGPLATDAAQAASRKNYAALILVCIGGIPYFLEASLSFTLPSEQRLLAARHAQVKDDNFVSCRRERPGAPLFVEYELTGVATLVDADDKFVLDCAQLIRNVSDVVRQVHPHSWL